MARAPINGDTLRWARVVSHLDRKALAKAAGVTPERIEEFETETTAPTFRQLALLATKLDRPLGFFFAPAPAIPDVPETADFRGRGQDELTANIAREMKRAEQHREAMLELAGPPGRALPLEPITRDSAAARALELRQQFGLTERFTPPESQQNQVFNFWRGLLEEHGCLIFQTTKIDLDAFRGLSVHHAYLPIIVLNGADSASGRVFTLFHEVAHLANRTSGLCVLDDEVHEEAVANKFAANFLMPEALVREHILDTQEPVELAAHLASALKVSPLAAGVRLRTLDLITEQDLVAIRQNSADTWRAARDAQKASDGFVPPWRLRYRDLGSKYIGAVARALQDGRIDATDATYLLNARWPMVEQLLDEYQRTGGEA
jgi:Zn-dependent peptidase ImmA (M78 family)